MINRKIGIIGKLITSVPILLSPLFASFIVDGGTVTLGNYATLEVSSGIVVGAGAVLDGGSAHINVARSFQNDGTFNCGTSTVTFYTTNTSTLTGNTTFYCLKCNTANKELRFEALSTQTVTNVLTLDGSIGNRIKLRSTLAGTTWYIRLLSSQTASYVNVKDGNAIDRTISCSESVDSGNNNDKWIFLAPDVTAPCAISNLTALTGTDNDGDVKLTWTAPGDDGTSGNLSGGIYRVKAATYSVTVDNFVSIVDDAFYSFAIDISTSYSTQGTEHCYTMMGLNPGTTYHFGIMTRDEAGNWCSTWTVTGVINTAASDQALDLVPSEAVVSAISNSSHTINVSWSKPVPTYVDDLWKYFVYRATLSFSSITPPYVFHIATVTHPSNSYPDSGLTTGTTYYYRVTVYDKGDEGEGLFSEVLKSALSNEASACPLPTDPGKVKVSVVYDSRSNGNKNNYDIISGIEDADGEVTFDWPFIPDGGEIENYFIEVSSDVTSDLDFTTYFSSATLPPEVSTYTVSGLSRGEYYYARVKAKNSEGTTGVWTVSDGIYINRKQINSDHSEWSENYASVADSVTVSSGDALWRDAVGDQRGDLHTSTQFDISSFTIACDRYNLYFYFSFASTSTSGFDGRNYFQIMVDNGAFSTERVFRGNGNQYQDSYCAGDVPWEYLIEIKTGNDVVTVENSLFSNTRYAKYAEHNAEHFYEIAVPLDFMGGADKFLGKTVNFTAATFWNDGGGVGLCGGTGDSNIVDVVTSSGTNTWNEVQDKVVDYYLAVTFSAAGIVTSAAGKKVASVPTPDEPEPVSNGVSPAPPSALDYILYNMFIDAWYNGDTSNDDINDTNDYGGDFQGVIDKIDYLNDMGINMAYFGPPTEFGGGIWGFNIDDAFKHETKFGGTSKYIEMVKALHNRNIDVMIDWVCGQVGSKDSPTAKKNPNYFQTEQFGWGTKQEFAEPRAFWLNNMIWYFSICDAFRYDNPKFWSYSGGPEAFEFNRALRKISDRWDPRLYIMGEIPQQVEGDDGINAFTGSNGPMIHGGQCMRSGGYKNDWAGHICAWSRPGDAESRTTIGLRLGLDEQQISLKNEWSINAILLENHDNHRYISRYRPGGVNGEWQSQAAHMTMITVGGPPTIFYGGEVGLEGDQTNRMEVVGNVRLMPFNRANESPWASVRNRIRRTVQAKANFQCLRGDPKKGGRSWYDTGQYDGEVVVFTRTGWGQKVIVMVNRSAGDVPLTDVGTGDNGAVYKDWLTDKGFTADGTGVLQEDNDDDSNGTNIFKVNAHDARILIRGGYDWVNVTGTVKNSANVPVEGAIVDIDQKSHWTTTTDANGYYAISGDMKKVLTGAHTVRVWADGYNIVSQAKTFTTATINNNVSFTNDTGYALTADNSGPAAPVSLAGQPRANAAMLSWQANTEDDFQTYLIYRSQSHIADGSFPAPVFEVFKTFYYDNNLDGDLDGNDNSINRLQNGTTYYYRIRAVDRNGNKSTLSNEITVVPRKVKVTFWLDTRDYGGTVNSASIKGGALTFSENYYESVALTSNGDGTFERTFEFDDTTFLEYIYEINGNVWEDNPGTFLDGSQGVSKRGELMDDAVPDVEIQDEGNGEMLIADVWKYYNDRAPKTPVVTPVPLDTTDNCITIAWTPNVEPDLDYYIVQRSTYSESAGFVEIRRAKDARNYVDENLTNNNTYYYKVNAVDRRGNGSLYTSVYSAFPKSGDSSPPAAPSGLAAYGSGENGLDGIKITWDLNSEGDLAGYDIHRATNSGFGVSPQNKLNATLISPVVSYYPDTGISVGVTYYYKLAARDSSGNSSPSSTQLYARLVPVVFKIDTGNINPADTEILGNTEPLYWTASSTMAKSGNVYSITMGFITGATIQYQFGYNNVAVKEQSFATDSGYREYLVPTASSTLNKNWEENPDGVSGTIGYPGVNKAYLYWDRVTTAEDIAGYNIYRNNGAGAPTILVNSSPVSYTQPYTVTDLNSGTNYSFKVLAADSCSPSLESSTWTVVSVYISSQVFVHFGVPYSAGLSSSPWGDSTRLKMYLAVMSSTQTSVWSSSDRADITGGRQEMTADADAGTYKTVVPLLKGEYYNFLFFAETTSDPPNGLKANYQYYDTVPNTGTFIVSTSSTSIAGDQTGVFYPAGTTRDARRVIKVPQSLADNSTWYVYANFGSSPTAPTYIQAIPSDGAAALYWSAPYGAAWVNIRHNEPTSAGEEMKAADVVCGGFYHIYMTTFTPGSFSSYKITATVAGTVFLKNFTGLSNSTTYYFLMRSSDTFKASAGGIGANICSVLSSTVSVRPNPNFIIAKIRVNSNASSPWPAVRKSIAMQEGTTVSAWDSDGRSNVTPTGRAVAMTAPLGLPDELEFSASLTPGTTYNFILFAHSTYSISGLLANTTYFDTVPASGSAGMLTSTSTLTTTNHGSVRFGNVGGTGETRRLLCVPKELASGTTVYVFCNFSGVPDTSEVYAVPVNSYTIQLDWSPYGSWGVGEETSKAADVLAGGTYEIYRSSVSEAGPYILILSTSGVSELTDNDRAAEGDNIGLLKNVEYFYVVVSSDAYCGDPAKAQIPNLARGGAPEFSSSDGSATPRETIPVYFKVDYIGPGKKKVFTIMLAGGFKIHGAGSSAVIR